MPKKWLKYISLFAKCYRNQKKCWQLFHLTLVTNGGGRPRWKVVTLSFVFFLTPSLSYSNEYIGEWQEDLKEQLEVLGSSWRFWWVGVWFKGVAGLCERAAGWFGQLLEVLCSSWSFCAVAGVFMESLKYSWSSLSVHRVAGVFVL